MKVLSVIVSILLAGGLVFWLVTEVIKLVKLIKLRRQLNNDKKNK